MFSPSNIDRQAIIEGMIHLRDFRQRLFLATVEPVIVMLLGPGKNAKENPRSFASSYSTSQSFREWGDSNEAIDSSHRRLSFLPKYVLDVSLYHETSMSFASFAMLFLIMGCIFLVFLSCFYHNQKTSPLFISPRRHRLPKLVPPPLPVDSAFSWIRICFYMSDEEIINRIGYDSLIFLRFHRLALRCIVKMSLFSFIVILPLNFTGGGRANASDLKGYVGTLLFTDFLRFSMANVSGGSPRLWVHCFAAYLLTAIVGRELLVEYEAYNNIRHRYLLSKEPHLRTVLVTNIPRHLRTPEKIKTYFKHVYPEAVKSVTMCQNLIKLEYLVSKRTATLAQIEQELLILCRREKQKLVGETKLQKIGSCFWLENIGLLDGKQERLAKLYNKLERLNNEIEFEQKRRLGVMKKLNSMEAGKGHTDIDYILASPYLHAQPQNQKGRDEASGESDMSKYLPPNVGAPRNPDGSVRASVKGSSKLGYPLSGGQLGTVSEHAVSSSEPVQDSPLKGVPDSDTVLRDEDSQNNDKKLRPFRKAKQAIKRYGRLNRDVNFLGRPEAESEDHVYTAFGEMPIFPHKKKNHIEDHTNEVCDKAFIVMRTFTASTIAIQSMHSSRPGSMLVEVAPEPRDILWNNVYVSKGAKRTRGYLGDLLILLIIAFYIVPVVLVSLLVSESALVSSSPRLAQLDQASAFFSSAIAMVQPICLVLIQQILPPLFIQISKAEGHVAFSEVQMRAFSRYFLFQVVNVFFVTIVGTSIFDTVAIIIENPESAFEMLGNQLPRMSSFFITYVTMKTGVGLGVEMVRTLSLVQASLRFILFPNSTLRAQRSVRIGMRAIDDPGWFPFHKILAQDMLVVVISVVFAVVAPIVLLPCALFCLFSRIIWTHHHLYVYESCFETGGQFWPKIFRRFVFGLIIAQATITGQFILKEARHEAYATMALMFLTYFFLRSTRARYDASSSTLPLEVATVMDITVSQEEEARKKQQALECERQKRQVTDSSDSHSKTDSSNAQDARISSNPSSLGAEEMPDMNLGEVIGQHDPFEHAYLQPALRATPHARPEQPFPPAQLGREEVFMRQFRDKGSTAGVVNDSIACDGGATVRLKSLNQQDRRLVNRWWEDQLQRAGDQNVLNVLIGKESGTLLIGKSASHL
eukprot:CAMPEP_0198302568 /NCGR_PEP_ID=MMETSP1449-20131203/55697_1 /TAXON_ID=420275 /ORGANISM="Attheya septentrionalis, Strain CCMP2084" /LENGTH=1146 /DNA_ID=CAMNT_0044004955 /DNA_START=194 /DNA_END=3634 /DNA_ORIENTATION=-